MQSAADAVDVPVVSAVGISKAFGPTHALQGVDFSVYSGEIHALLGENGAGKSTLAGVLSGAMVPDSGVISVSGEPVSFESTRDALRQGVAIVHQELALMASLTVEQNLSLGLIAAGRGAENGRDSGRGRINLADRISDLMSEFSLERYAGRRVGELSQAVRQIVEIARALSLRAAFLILDEPTAALPPRERQGLYERLEVLRARGMAVVLITHMLEEAVAVSDRITVLRDGRRVGTLNAADATVDALIEMMTGRPLGSAVQARRAHDLEDRQSAVLEVRGLVSEPVVEDVSFQLRPGEILGIAGLMGSGRTETLEAIFGARPRNGDSVLLEGRPLKPGSTRRSLAAGMAFLPEDRQAAGLFGSLSIAENIAIGAITVRRGRWQSVVSRAGWLRRSGITSLAWQLGDEVDIVARDMSLPVGALSGGNQQKALLGRLLATSPRLLLADEPTRGVSVGSRIQIYEVLRKLADAGMSICIASSDFEELVMLCERIVLLVRGRSREAISVAGMTADELLEAVLAANRSVAAPGLEKQ
jgi:ribose transport system ATP-binding protein